MAKIRILPEHLANQIAAGEVVEAVLHQFFDHRCRSFHHFAGGNLIDQMRGQRMYPMQFWSPAITDRILVCHCCIGD